MTALGPKAASHNPFVTRHTRPGSLSPRDRHGEPLDVAAIAARARALRTAAIEGPHGAGKTNLLVAIARHLAADGSFTATVRVRTRRDAAAVLRAARHAAAGSILCIDGWEALGWMGAALIRRLAGLRRVGLLVTCHRAAGLPVLVRCTTTPALLARLVADLPDHGGLIGESDIAEAFAVRGGDVREALYDLYDRFERRARRG